MKQSSQTKNKGRDLTAERQERRKESIMMTNKMIAIATKPAIYFTFDHIGKRIRGSEASFKKAEIFGTAQYEALMEAMERHPSYTLTPIPAAKKVEKKQSYKGLTSELIAEYIETFGNEAQKAEHAKMVDDNEHYPAIKSWFLDYFRVGFTVEKAKREIANRKLNTKKATVRKAVKANLTKAAAAADAASLSLVSNF